MPVRSLIHSTWIARLLRLAIRRSLGDRARTLSPEELDQCARLWGLVVGEELQRRFELHCDPVRLETDARQVASRTPSDAELSTLLACAQSDLEVQAAAAQVRGSPDAVADVVCNTVARHRSQPVAELASYLQAGERNQRLRTRQRRSRERSMDPNSEDFQRVVAGRRGAGSPCPDPNPRFPLLGLDPSQLPPCPRCRESRRPYCGSASTDAAIHAMALLLISQVVEDADPVVAIPVHAMGGEPGAKPGVPLLAEDAPDFHLLATLGNTLGVTPFHTPQGRSRTATCLLHRVLCLRWIAGQDENCIVLEQALRERIAERASNPEDDYAPDRRANERIDEHLLSSRQSCEELARSMEGATR